MDAGGLRMFLLKPAMGFGRPRLVMTPVGVLGARLPPGVHVHGVVGFVAFPSPSATSSRRAAAVPALATVGGRVPGSLFAAPIGAAGNAIDSSSTGRGGSFGWSGATRTTNSYPILPSATPSSQLVVAGLPRSGGRVPGSSPSTGRPRGFGWSGATRTNNYSHSNPDDDDDDDDEEEEFRKPANLFDPNPRSKRDITSWIELARLQTFFEVAFDAGALESGSDLRRVLDAIGEIDITAPGRPWSSELCSDRIRAVIGAPKLEELLKARIPPEDKQFVFSAFAGQSMIEAIEHLMAILHSLLYPVLPNFVLCKSCPIILQQLLKAICEFSTLIESTKFKRTQSSIRYPMLEAHARALEQVCAIAMDVYEEACQEEPKEMWAGLRQELRNRRITLLEQDVGVVDYVLAIGVSDTERVCELILDVALCVRVRAGSAGSSN